jgi:sugar lactone lactonase YvrE
MWFSAFVAIGRITPTGTVTYFNLPAGARVATPGRLVVGPDGNLWFPDMGNTKAIGRITPAGVITEFSKGLNQHHEPHSIIAGPDGNLWFLEGCRDGENTCPIGRITPSGVITEFVEGLPKYGRLESLALGADHNIWGTECLAPRRGGTCSVIARITIDATNRAKCVVPKLKGKTLTQAKQLLARAHCKLGRVTKPTTHKRTLVVVSQKPAAKKSLSSGAKVSLRLG